MKHYYELLEQNNTPSNFLHPQKEKNKEATNSVNDIWAIKTGELFKTLKQNNYTHTESNYFKNIINNYNGPSSQQSAAAINNNWLIQKTPEQKTIDFIKNNKNDIISHLILKWYDSSSLQNTDYMVKALFIEYIKNDVNTWNKDEIALTKELYTKYCKNPKYGTTVNQRRFIQLTLFNKGYYWDNKDVFTTCDGIIGNNTKTAYNNSLKNQVIEKTINPNLTTPQINITPIKNEEQIKQFDLLSTPEKEKLLMDELIRLWYNDIVAAWILGNAYIEWFNYKKGEQWRYDTSVRWDWTSSIWIFQRHDIKKWKAKKWDNRMDDLKSFAKSKNDSYTNYKIQLEFMNKELNWWQWVNRERNNITYTKDMLLESKTADKAAENFCWLYERPNKSNSYLADRKKAAIRIYNNYKKK